MKNKEFKYWIRSKLQNHQEIPPADVWGNIDNQLDIDDTWTRISSRLDTTEKIARYERFSQLIAASILLLLIPYFVQKNLPEYQTKTVETTAEREKSNHDKNTDSGFRNLNKIENTASEENNIKTFDNNIITPNFIAADKKIKPGVQKTTGYNKLRKKNLKAEPMKYNYPTIIEPVSLTTTVTESNHSSKNYYFGISTTVKNNWLVNNTTINGLDRYELNATIPDFGRDIGFVAGIELSDHWSLQLESYVISDMGQKYQEYINGKYVTREIDIDYFKNSILLKYKWNTISHSYSNVLFGLSGNFQNNAVEIIDDTEMAVDDIYDDFDLSGILGYDHEFPVMNNIVFVSGIRLNYGFRNIYEGNDAVPANFRVTSTAAIGLNLSVKYQFR